MLIQDFLEETLQAIGRRGDVTITKSAVTAAAQQTFSKTCDEPEDTEVKLICAGTRTKLLKISVKLLPEHPLFRPWLKPRVCRASRPIADLVCGNRFQKTTLTLVDDEIEALSFQTIIQELIDDIQQQIKTAEEILQELHSVLQKHNLTGDSAYQLYQLSTQLLQRSLLKDSELLRLDTVHRLLEIKE